MIDRNKIWDPQELGVTPKRTADAKMVDSDTTEAIIFSTILITFIIIFLIVDRNISLALNSLISY